MNLRDKFIWNVLLGFTLISLIWFGWDLFNNTTKTNNLYNKYINEQVGTDQKLQDKVTTLESIYKFRNSNKFKVDNNPFEVTRVLSGSSGSGKKGQIYTTGIYQSENGDYKATINVKGKTYTVVKGNSLQDGEITEINKNNVVWLKNGVEKNLPLNIEN